ncbi:MAG TPA: hypothetical protein VG206_13705 [Terriglobia bacterium]|nr:hypothetical protein [Terriglobia bacterium]
MTQENEAFITLDEVIGIQLECGNPECATKITLGPNKWDELPHQCPACHEDLWKHTDAQNSDSAGREIHNLLRSLRRLVEYKANGKKYDEYRQLTCTVRLQIVPPDR